MKGTGKATINGFKDLIAYQKAYQLASEVLRISANFPREEQFGLSAQIRRAAVSIPSNIAEGYRRSSRKEYIQFLSIAHGSCGEVQTQIALSHDMAFINDADFERLDILGEEVSKLLWGLIKSLQY